MPFINFLKLFLIVVIAHLLVNTNINAIPHNKNLSIGLEISPFLITWNFLIAGNIGYNINKNHTIMLHGHIDQTLLHQEKLYSMRIMSNIINLKDGSYYFNCGVGLRELTLHKSTLSTPNSGINTINYAGKDFGVELGLGYKKQKMFFKSIDFTIDALYAFIPLKHLDHKIDTEGPIDSEYEKRKDQLIKKGKDYISGYIFRVGFNYDF